MKIKQRLRELMWVFRKRVICSEWCQACGTKFPPFDSRSEHEVFIRRYMGGHGHLVDLGYHRGCLRREFLVDNLLDGGPTVGV